MPYADPLKRKEYFKEYYRKHKFNTDQPELTEQELDDKIDGMTQREIDEFNEIIEQELNPKFEIPERYQRLKGDALAKIKAGISSLMYDIDNKETLDIDPNTYKAKPIQLIDEDSEIISWEHKEP